MGAVLQSNELRNNQGSKGIRQLPIKVNENFIIKIWALV